MLKLKLHLISKSKKKKLLLYVNCLNKTKLRFTLKAC